jgi:predicted DNA-binding transcriptional regulator YafY
MAFEKAQQLIDVATFVASRRFGVTVEDVRARYECSKRTAQRLLHTLEVRFPDTEYGFDEDGRKRWKLRTGALRDLLTLSPDELAALDLSIEMLRRNAQGGEAAHLETLREKVVALVPRDRISRIETDHEALLEAQGLAARPGPSARLAPDVASTIAMALKACVRLKIVYLSRGASRATARLVEPYGILIGARRYLVARAASDPHGPLRHYLAENIRSAEPTGEHFERDRDFAIDTHAQKAFGTFQNDAEIEDVVWRFAPEAADHARAFVFHPAQILEDQPDGSLVVRFRAAGQLEMCWHLYTWGNRVEVLAPKSLRRMVHPYRRSDFAALP